MSFHYSPNASSAGTGSLVSNITGTVGISGVALGVGNTPLSSSQIGTVMGSIPLLQYRITPLTASDGQYLPFQGDINGNQRSAEQFAPGAEDNVNNVFATSRKPVASPTYAWSTAYTTVSASNLVAKASAGLVRKVVGDLDNSLATGTYWIMVIDAATATNGAVTLLHHPKKILHAAGVSQSNCDAFEFNFEDEGRYAASGIVVALSTTSASTLTLGASQMNATVLYK